MPLEEGVQADDDDRADHVRLVPARRVFRIGRGARSRGVAEQEVALELLQLLRRHRDVLELAEAGGDAVFEDRPDVLAAAEPVEVVAVAGGEPLDLLAARADPGERLLGDLQAHPRIAGDPRQILDRQRAAVEDDGVGYDGMTGRSLAAHRPPSPVWAASISRTVATRSPRGTSRCPGRASSHSSRRARASAFWRPTSMSFKVTTPRSFSLEP